MSDDFSLKPLEAGTAAALEEVRGCEPLCERWGLPLTEKEMAELVSGRQKALADSGRVEFGGGILPKLIYAFCDSPYVSRDTWADTLAQLQEAFYLFKSESEDRYTDDELIGLMAKVFNGRAQGSIDFLTGTSLASLCRCARQEKGPRDGKDEGELF